MLAGGHPNSLGRTVEVVDAVLTDPPRFDELLACYESEDEVVRLRTSNALKRVEKERHDLLVPRIEHLLGPMARIDQPSTQWTLAQLLLRLTDDMDALQRERAKALVLANLRASNDWIVLNASMEALAAWSRDDGALANDLRLELERLSGDDRKSVAGRARRLLLKLPPPD